MSLEQGPRTVLLTGASGVIGQALALEYAGPDTTLLLFGRNEEQLESIAQQCKSSGAIVHTWSVDLTEPERATAAMLAADDAHRIDLAIANAGVMVPSTTASERWEDIERTLNINVTACLSLAVALAERMVERGHGQIALMSSIASFHGMPGAPSYSASKAAVRVFGEALRARLVGTGVRVCVVSPGYVRSPMGNAFPAFKMGVLSPEKTARHIVRSLARNKGRITFPFMLALGTSLLALLPAVVSDHVLRLISGRNRGIR